MNETVTAEPVGQQQAVDPQGAPIQGTLGGEVKQGVQPDSWRSKLPEDVRDNPSLAKFKDEAAMAKSYLELQKMMGSNRLEKPSEDWTPDKWDKFYSDLGRPETPDKYQYDEPQLPEGLNYDKDLEGRFNNTFHKAGLSAKQAAIIRDEFVQHQGAVHSQMVQAREQYSLREGQKLKQEWGDQYDARMDAAFRAAKEFGGQEMAQALTEAGMGAHPALLRAFSKMGMLTLSGGLKTGRGGGEFMMGKDEALIKLQEFKEDKALQDRFNKGDKEVIAQRAKLYKIAYGA